jgi:hypothetical protein
LGIPIEGDLSQTRSLPAQKPLEEFQPLVRALLDDPLIQDFGWTQYTPYFMDGDVCEFSAHGLWVRTVHDKSDASGDQPTIESFREYEDAYSVEYGTHPTLGYYVDSYDSEVITGKATAGDYIGAHQATYDHARALNSALESGHYDHVLQELFGDHAIIQVNRDKISIEYYDHD